MPNREIIRAWEEGYQIGQRDLRKDLPCEDCPRKALAMQPNNVISMVEYMLRRRQN